MFSVNNPNDSESVFRPRQKVLNVYFAGICDLDSLWLDFFARVENVIMRFHLLFGWSPAKSNDVSASMMNLY